MRGRREYRLGLGGVVLLACFWLTFFVTWDQLHRIPSAEGSLRPSNHFDARSARCIMLENVPGKSPPNSKGEVAYITSYAWIPSENAFYVVTLGAAFFAPQLGKGNVAYNRSFAFTSLQHPFKLFPTVLRGRNQLLCEAVTTGSVDVSMHEKVQVMRCVDPSGQPENVVDVIELHMSYGGPCLLLTTGTPRGVLSSVTSGLREGTRAAKSTKTMMSLCIAGVRDFTPFAHELLTWQLTGLGVDHIYLGINRDKTDPVTLKYTGILRQYIDQGVVDVASSPAPNKDVIFSQGKLPFINECLLISKFLGDKFLGVWDMDEIVMARRMHGNLAEVLQSQVSEDLHCHIGLEAISVLRGKGNDAEHNVHLMNQFGRMANQSCGNYTKAVLLVKNVQFVGNHLPESCRFFPKSASFSPADASFVWHPPRSELVLAHFVQLWDAKRFDRKCYPEQADREPDWWQDMKTNFEKKMMHERERTAD